MFEKLSNSTRKFIRSEKARIRCQFFDFKKQEEMIGEIYNKLLNRQPVQENIKKQEVKKKEKLNQKGTSSSQARAKKQEVKKRKTKKTKIRRKNNK